MSSLKDGEAEPLRFMADGMLKRLSKWLRIMGYDVQYSGSGIADKVLIDRCRKGGLILLTRDYELYRSYEKAVLIRSVDYHDQTLQVASKFPPMREAFFTRCPECNGILDEVRSADYSDKLPEGIVNKFKEVYKCKLCGKFYWNGTHYDKIKQSIEKILSGVENENNE